MRLLVLGNSGSGKTTFARAAAARHGLVHLDLDTLAWEPGAVAVPRDPAAVRADLQRFLDAHERWVVEGCYAELARLAAPRCTRLVFLNPGVQACLANNRRRPWEPHKYASPAEQDAMLDVLQAWVAAYHERDDDWSYAAHRRLFDGFAGEKVEWTGEAGAAHA